jgi:hypothetical protein
MRKIALHSGMQLDICANGRKPVRRFLQSEVRSAVNVEILQRAHFCEVVDRGVDDEVTRRLRRNVKVPQLKGQFWDVLQGQS